MDVDKAITREECKDSEAEDVKKRSMMKSMLAYFTRGTHPCNYT